MKKNLLSLIFLFGITSFLFSQPKLIREFERYYDANDAIWKSGAWKNYEYDEQGRRISTLEYILPNAPGAGNSNNMFDTKQDYHENGNLIYYQYISWDTEFPDEKWGYRYEYEYDNSGNRTFLTRKNLDQTDQVFINASKENWIYNSDGNTEEYTNFYWNSTLETWEVHYKVFFEYNENGCLSERTKVEEENNCITEQTVLENDENCELMFQMVYCLDGGNQTPISKTTFEKETNPTLERFISETYFENVDSFKISRIGETGYDENGNVTRSYFFFPGEIWINGQDFAHLYEAEYDNNRIIYSATYSTNFATGNFELENATHYQYEFDENNWLTKYIEENTNRTDKIEHLEYYCDGILKQKYIEELPIISQRFYNYDEKLTDCETITNFDISIFPNPTSEELFIKSAIPAFENATVNIFSHNGILIKQQDVNVRTTFLILDVGDLNAGHYFIEIKSDERRLSSSFQKF